VSRVHAYIKYKGEKFHLYDNKSKFGTLLLVNDYLNLDPDFTWPVQIGRTVITFGVKNKVNGNYEPYKPSLSIASKANLFKSSDSDDHVYNHDIKVQATFKKREPIF